MFGKRLGSEFLPYLPKNRRFLLFLFALHNAQKSLDDIMQLGTFKTLHETWTKYNLEGISGLSWERMVKDFLFNAIRRVEVRAVNQKTGAKSLDYKR